MSREARWTCLWVAVRYHSERRSVKENGGQLRNRGAVSNAVLNEHYGQDDVAAALHKVRGECEKTKISVNVYVTWCEIVRTRIAR